MELLKSWRMSLPMTISFATRCQGASRVVMETMLVVMQLPSLPCVEPFHVSGRPHNSGLHPPRVPHPAQGYSGPPSASWLSAWPRSQPLPPWQVADSASLLTEPDSRLRAVSGLSNCADLHSR